VRRLAISTLAAGPVGLLALCLVLTCASSSCQPKPASSQGESGNWTYDQALTLALEQKNVGVCDRINQPWPCHGDDVPACEPARARVFCKLQYAANTGKVDYCLGLSRKQVPGSLSDHDICLQEMAYRTLDPALCGKIDSRDHANVCRYRLDPKVNAPGVTEAIRSQDLRRSASLSGEKQLAKEPERDQCYRGIAATGTVAATQCDALRLREEQERCRKAFGR
jgi:hypothetical protein